MEEQCNDAVQIPPSQASLCRRNSGRRKNEDMVTERLHYFHPRVNGQKYSFGSTEPASSDSKLDDLCPASLEQRVTACTDVFDVWNTEARRRRASFATRGAFHNPRRRTLSTGLSSFSFVSAEGSTSERERARSDSISRSSSSSVRSNTLVIRITPSNSSTSLSDLQDAGAHEQDACGRSSPSSGCVLDSDISEVVARELPISLGSSSSRSSISELASISEIHDLGQGSEGPNQKESFGVAIGRSVMPCEDPGHPSANPQADTAGSVGDLSRYRRILQRLRRFRGFSRLRAQT